MISERRVLINPEAEASSAIRRSIRHEPPAHFMLKINSFSELWEMTRLSGDNKIESREFVVRGHKWKMLLYPNGNWRTTENGYLSLYLAVGDTYSRHPGWEISVIFRFFVFDQIRDRYLSIEDGKVRRFYFMKTKWGFDKILSLNSFKDQVNGFLVNDSCAFGVEVLVLDSLGVAETLSIVNNPWTAKLTWKVENFSSIQQASIRSETFRDGFHGWKLLLYTRGDDSTDGNYMSLFLRLHDSNHRVCAKYKLSIKNQLAGTWIHVQQAVKWFRRSPCSWGCPQFIRLIDLFDVSNGYLVDDTLIIRGQISVVSVTKPF